MHEWNKIAQQTHKPNCSNEINWPKIALAKYFLNAIFCLCEFFSVPTGIRQGHSVPLSELKYQSSAMKPVGFDETGALTTWGMQQWLYDQNRSTELIDLMKNIS